jgi:hypothetical protein
VGIEIAGDISTRRNINRKENKSRVMEESEEVKQEG